MSDWIKLRLVMPSGDDCWECPRPLSIVEADTVDGNVGLCKSMQRHIHFLLRYAIRAWSIRIFLKGFICPCVYVLLLTSAHVLETLTSELSHLAIG